MSVVDVTKDAEARTMEVTAEFDVPVERAWQLWENPRQLERWWGPPGYPATFVSHGLAPGETVTYYMTGPEGDRHHGWWRIIAAAPPNLLEFEDGFGEGHGAPSSEMPVMIMRAELTALPQGRTRMVILTSFPSDEAMEQVLAMGMEEGLRAAIGQIPGVLAV